VKGVSNRELEGGGLSVRWGGDLDFGHGGVTIRPIFANNLKYGVIWFK
jgi:hypothetical protein